MKKSSVLTLILMTPRAYPLALEYQRPTVDPLANRLLIHSK